jgi:hypothetical protein
MTSKFSFKSFFPILCIPPLIFGLICYINFTLNETESPPLLNGIPLVFLLTFAIAWLFFGEFRAKMIKVIIEDDYVIIKKFGGLSTGKKYLYSDIDGFKISILHSTAMDNEYLYLIQRRKKIAKISDFYHKNYYNLKEELKTRLKDLGFDKFSYVEELKEIFT